EGDFAADGGDAEAIAVVADAADDAIEDAAIFGRIFWGRALTGCDFAEAERVEHGDRASTHGENVAQDAADTGRRALEGFDGGGVVVGLDLESGDEAVTDIDYPGVFAGPLYDEFAACGQSLEMDFARFVGAVLAPHHGEDAEFGDIGIAAKDLLDARVFF